jgi:PST family polysaccharide transporter
LYSAAYQLSGLYVGIILGAMGRDFFPRLTGASADPERRTRLVNEQIHVGVLLATPGVLATLGLCSWALRILAGTRYLGAVPIVEWQIIGVFVQTMSWPIGYVLLAKADGKAYIWSEVATTVLYVGFVLVAIRLWGLEGAGIGFLMMEGFHWLLTYFVVKWRHGLSFSRDNIVLCLVSLPMLAAVFLAARFAPSPWGTIVAVVVTLVSLAYSMVALGRLLGEPAHRVALRSLKRLAPRR